jgi:hypothetical protein
MDLFQENVIVTATSFNVQIFSQLWLSRNDIVTPDEFDRGTSVFTPPMVHIDIPRQFALIILQDRLQFVPTCDEEHKSRLIAERIGRLVELLPHTPYSAAGLNFIWHLRPRAPLTISAIGRNLFFRENTPIAREFNVEDAKFGGYYSKNAIGFRLKLSTAPVDIKHGEELVEEVIQFSFNYHLGSTDYIDIRAALNRWDEAKAHSLRLAGEIEEAL